MSTTFGELREVGVPVRRACELVGRARGCQMVCVSGRSF